MTHRNKTIGLLLLGTVHVASAASNNPYYSSDERVQKGGNPNVYSAALHNSMPSIKSEYEENGKFYYNGSINSFGFQEVLNTKQEVVFCDSNDKNFSDIVVEAAATHPSSYAKSYLSSGVKQGSQRYGIADSATTVGMSAEAMVQSIGSALVNNGQGVTPQAKGRICYKKDDSRVDYRNSGSNEAVYCNSEQERTYVDPVSGYSCKLKLDVPLKVGETKFLRQLQTHGVTVAQGFLGCYSNPTSGAPELSLIDNPSSCSASNREDCNRTCDWADEVVCDPRDMPRWGAVKSCGGYGTVIFKGDFLSVESSNQLSFDLDSGKLFKGSATMQCVVVESSPGVRSASWAIVDSSCDLQP